MYPNLFYWLKDYTGIDFPLAKHINMLGLFVVLAFIAASNILSNEIKRKASNGLLIVNEKNKVGSVSFVALLAAIAGVIGAKFSGIVESFFNGNNHTLSFYWGENGYSFYGGVIVATATLWIYYQNKKINPLVMADAIAPGLMMAYAIGRIGCHIAGDGDWGISNHFIKPVYGLPNWLWACYYPHNILKAGVEIYNCTWDDYCYQLLEPVFPTSLYETIFTMLLFLIIWGVRKKIKLIGTVTALYLICTGIERFLIEFIRINPRVDFGGLPLTQAQIISLLFILLGIGLYFFVPKLTCNKQAVIY